MLFIWQACSCILVAPEARLTLTIGITGSQARSVKGCTDITRSALFAAVAVGVLWWLGVALDIFMLTVKITIVKLTALGHVDGTVIGVEALWVTVADVLFTWVTTVVDTVLWGYELTAVDVGITRTADLLLIARFTFRYTEEPAEAIVTRVCPCSALLRDRAWLMARVTEGAAVVMTDLVAFRAVQVRSMVEHTDTTFKVTELTFAAVGIGIAAGATLAVGKAEEVRS